MPSEFPTTPADTRIPPFLYGTAWKEDATERCVLDALTAGFHGIDTANQRKHYFEAAVGAAIQVFLAQASIARSGLFLQTKFTSLGGQDHRLPYNPKAPLADQVHQSFASSLEHLHTDYIDSYVLHGPSSAYSFTTEDWEIWRAMEDIHQSGKAKLLGISNVNLDQLRALCAKASVKPTFVQNRCYAQRAWDKDIRDFCRENKIIYQGFSLLTANAQIFRNPKFLAIVQRANCTSAQAVFAFARQIEMLPLTGTTNPTHMREDLQSIDTQLDPDDIKTMEELAI